jgi:hypothetical protein
VQGTKKVSPQVANGLDQKDLPLSAPALLFIIKDQRLKKSMHEYLICHCVAIDDIHDSSGATIQPASCFA